MGLSTTTTDNITEVLNKIIEFTESYDQLLLQNISAADKNSHTPLKLDDDQFANLMTQAVCEHIKSQRLLLQDSQNVKFGTNGRLKLTPITDHKSARLLRTDTKQYMELQIKRLAENMANRNLARHLLKEKERRLCQ